METKTFVIRLPFFSGFYNTIWDDATDDATLMDMFELDKEGVSKLEFDFNSYSADITKEVTSETEGYFQKTFKGVIGLTLKELDRPREYNFRNDIIYANLEVDYDTFWKHFLELIEKHKEIVTKKLIDTWSSRSGFISFLSTDLDTWLSDIENEGELGWLMGVVYCAEMEETTDDVEQRIYEELCSNGYDELSYYK
jgi:hypothetical protein